MLTLCAKFREHHSKLKCFFLVTVKSIYQSSLVSIFHPSDIITFFCDFPKLCLNAFKVEFIKNGFFISQLSGLFLEEK